MRLLVLAWILLALACDGVEPPPCAAPTSRTAQAIRLTDAGVPPADEIWRGLPIRLDVRGTIAGQPIERMCTAIRVAETGVLTAAHCFKYLEAGSGRVGLQDTGADQGTCTDANTFSLADVSLHPTRDAAFITVAGLSVGEIAVLSTALPAPRTSVVLAGYGLTERATTGELRAISATVLSADADRVLVQGTGGGACLGDSGGPLLLRGQRISLGVLSQGSASCEGSDEYVPSASLAEWLGTLEPAISWIAP